ncbi:hyalin-like [Acanthaster planci]|uniref:Hyalin-like n=1 Tax=Acanthaster planci TaxID=133434 RepID=A0A8B7Z237_ACAPL|nr:hyalin-like [Acanthaster planci]
MNITVIADRGEDGRTVNWEGPQIFDVCEGTRLRTQSHRSGERLPLGTTMISYEFEDQAGNVGGCTFAVTVEDDVPPTVVCPRNITDMGGDGRSIFWEEPETFDTFEGVRLRNQSHRSGERFSLGTTVVSYEFEDQAGNVGGCTFAVTVEDFQIQGCPEDIQTFTSFNETPVVWIPPSVSDASISNITLHRPGDIFPVGNTTVSYLFFNNVENFKICEFTVMVIFDDVPPTVVCPMNITAKADRGEDRQSIRWEEPQTFDAYEGVRLRNQSHRSGARFPFGTTMISYEFEDQAGNIGGCTFAVTVEGFQIQDCPSDIQTFTSLGGRPVEWVPPSVLDTLTTVSSTHDPGDVFPVGNTTVLYLFTDGESNQERCQFTVMVIFDNVAPTVVCPMNMTVVVDRRGDGQTIRWEEPQTFDAYEGVRLRNQSHRSGERFRLGTTMISYEFEDQAGNVGGCSFAVTVEAEPIIVTNCPVEGVSLSVEVVRWIPSDSLGISLRTEGPQARLTQQPEGVFDIGVTPVVYTFTDVNNAANTATCSFNVTIIPLCLDGDHTFCYSRSKGSGGVCIGEVSLCDTDEGSEMSFYERLVYPEERCQEWAGAMETDDPEGNEGLMSQFEVPSINQDPIHLTAVYPGLTTPDTTEVSLRIPLAVRPGEIVSVRVSYAYNLNRCYRPLPIQSTCTDCLSVQYRTPAADCGEDRCLQEFKAWRGIRTPAGPTPSPLPRFDLRRSSSSSVQTRQQMKESEFCLCAQESLDWFHPESSGLLMTGLKEMMLLPLEEASPQFG